MSLAASEVLKVAPVVAAAGVDMASRLWGLTPSEWFYIAATIYAIAQTICLIYKTFKEDLPDV